MCQEGGPSQLPRGVGVKLYVWCSDALAFYKQVKAKGIDAQEPFVRNGMWVVEMTDPDGYDIAFQSHTTVPEETKLSDLK